MIDLKINNPFNAPVFHEETVTSTMDISRKLQAQGQPHGTVITSDFQENGRGRIRGRLWEMQKGESLPFTVLFRFQSAEKIPSALTLRAGLAVALAIENSYASLLDLVKIKWPNDILINSKKIAGILCEAQSGNVHLGIGINTAQKEFPSHLKEKAASLALCANINIAYNDRFILLEKILLQLYNELETPLGEDWRARLEKRLFKKDENVIFIDGEADSGKEVKGILKGINNDGALIIETNGKIFSFITGELRF
ncbi:MAG: biotin--[acetyl-CoA-carboxylase] ligase [Treponema sp.]|nr:biotin--[acetyl-CoA-carboxylase] ligase [Treponema sp.]MCL2252228.1 biotin--[acetyl-CoA-carboxylase] ligase [Treponema sp.]